ncbi:MAG: phosphatase PAP2 family protein [Bacteroidales bacterium]|jgi:membrane-associated phospholipid phosphatase|nr:phosphatase PAP2 family protein [Bacteroidales bacterium]
MKTLFRQNIYYFITIFILIISGGLILLFSSKEGFSLWVNARYSGLMDIVILGINQIGTVWFNALIVILLWLWKGWKTALQGASCFAVTVLVIAFFKYVVFPGTPRPTVLFEGREILRLIEGVVQLKTESFPSGHTASAFSIATVLAFLLPGKQYHWLLALAAALVGYGRIYLSQHFITDVYAGMIIAVIVSTFIYWWMERVLHINNPVQPEVITNKNIHPSTS